MATLGYINSTESFGSVDGPGLRFIFFMQGCPLRCRYCHNPETWAKTGAQYEWTAEEALAKAMRYKSYWGKTGGITVSGGEGLLQMQFVTELFELAKTKNINTCLDTAGGNFEVSPEFDRLMKATDLFILDLKHIDPEKHKDLTGKTNENILQMARCIGDNGGHLWVRHVLVPGLTDDENDLQKLSDFIATLKNVDRVEVLPYHSMAIHKWEELGIEYTLKDTPVPTEESVKRAEEILKVDSYQNYKNQNV